MLSPCSPRPSPWSAVTRTQRAGELPLLLQLPQEAAELRVDERHLAVVRLGARSARRTRRAARRARGGRSSGPRGRRGGARGAGSGVGQPPQDRVGRGVGEALDVRRAAGVVALRQVVVVGLEAAVEAEAAVRGGSRTRTPPSGSRPSRSPRPRCGPGPAGRSRRCRGSRGRAGCSPVRIEAWEGPVSGTWATAVAKRTPRAARPSSVGVSAWASTVAADVVGAQRVDRDQEDVRPLGGGARSAPPAGSRARSDTPGPARRHSGGPLGRSKGLLSRAAGVAEDVAASSSRCRTEKGG